MGYSREGMDPQLGRAQKSVVSNGSKGSPRKKAAALAVLAAALTFGMAGCGVADSAPRSQPVRTTTVTGDPIDARAGVTYIAECEGDRRVSRPTTFLLACGDGGEALDSLSWRAWGEEEAHASGELVYNDCTPSCAQGKDITVPVTVVADEIVEGEASATYRRLTVTTNDKNGQRTQQIYRLPGNEPGERDAAGPDPGSEEAQNQRPAPEPTSTTPASTATTGG
ncbi:hypothetical protein KILIM_072_00120 [Kineosphaera limosa NBRC 100340]|uniref:Uncharacterized protein n=1 Tax=Kineosphaera limosa NBRC 100340 TaxID=1184609 RepID=K6VMQ1_9MICO|nr:hypothetical protein KILIM_072_00120 [Kineosphaera limosa NBRC 100340]